VNTRELVEQQRAARRLAFVVWAVSHGRINDFALRDEDGAPVLDPSIRATRTHRPAPWWRTEAANRAARERLA